MEGCRTSVLFRSFWTNPPKQTALARTTPRLAPDRPILARNGECLLFTLAGTPFRPVPPSKRPRPSDSSETTMTIARPALPFTTRAGGPARSLVLWRPRPFLTWPYRRLPFTGRCRVRTHAFGGLTSTIRAPLSIINPPNYFAGESHPGNSRIPPSMRSVGDFAAAALRSDFPTTHPTPLFRWILYPI